MTNMSYYYKNVFFNKNKVSNIIYAECLQNMIIVLKYLNKMV